MTSPTTIPTFFTAGIRFECVHCGVCCTGDAGIVAMQPSEIEALAAHLHCSVATCISDYLLPHEGGYRIKERPNGDCIFFAEGCSVHPVRPAQCRTYPFWTKNMRSEDAWERTCRDCPGIGAGPLHTEDEILNTLRSSPI